MNFPDVKRRRDCQRPDSPSGWSCVSYAWTCGPRRPTSACHSLAHSRLVAARRPIHAIAENAGRGTRPSPTPPLPPHHMRRFTVSVADGGQGRRTAGLRGSEGRAEDRRQETAPVHPSTRQSICVSLSMSCQTALRLIQSAGQSCLYPQRAS